jgi:CubicO group peptidase (beta-lactamase class C family)
MLLNLRRFYLAGFIFLFSFSLSAQQSGFEDHQRTSMILSTKTKVDALYKGHASTQHMPGMLYAVISADSILFWGDMGVQDVQSKTPVSRSTIFRIASMSKSFTAMAILQLRDKGKLLLDEPADKYVPELKRLKYPGVDAPRITIRHLLSHLAGFPQDDPYGDRQLSDSEKEFTDFLNSSPSFSNTPGIEYEYSNLGFSILGRIITNVARQPYQEYITKNIFLPLGMKNTYWDYSKVPAANFANGHRYTENGFIKEIPLHDGAWGAMGGILTNMEDLQKYMRLHLNAWPPSDIKETGVLKRSSLREMHTPQSFSGLNTSFQFISGASCALSNAYGFGLRIIRDCNHKLYVGHSGGLPGYGSNWYILPEYGIGVMAFGNVTYAPLGNFNISILDTIVKMSGISKRIIPVSPILNQRARELAAVVTLWREAERSGIFAENFFVDYPINNLEEQSNKLFTQLGRIKKIHPVKAINRLRGTFIIEGEKASAEIFFTLSPESVSKIQAVEMKIADK